MSILSSIGPEIPFLLVLLALVGLKANVKPRASLWINVPPDVLFPLVDLYDGKTEKWASTVTTAKLIDAARQLFHKTYVTTLSNGTVQSFSAQFSITSREPNRSLSIAREGLEGKSLNNELLSQHYLLAAEGTGTRLSMTYEWGPRPLMAQILARADIWGGIYRLKGLAETGVPWERPYQLITAAIALCTGLISFLAFSIFLGVWISALIILALFIHELGHLIAFRLMGQPWGRMVFMPFLGAVAMPRLPFQSQGQSVFAALMGPGFSVLMAIACAAPFLAGTRGDFLLLLLGLVTVGLNLFNLLPVEPLDGGVALRSVLVRLIGRYARLGLLAIAAIIIAAGFYFAQIIIVIFGFIAFLANIRSRIIDGGLLPLTGQQVAITATCYIAVLGCYVSLLNVFLDELRALQI